MNNTFSVLKLLRSRDVNDVQSLNILVMLYTLEVLKTLMSKLFNNEHP